MKKIISLYQRNYDGDHLVRDEVVPGAEWVLTGEGIATRKFDGTCCMVRAGKLFKRYDAKAGKTPPPGFEPAQDADPKTGHWPGWLPVGEGPEDRWHREAYSYCRESDYSDGIIPDGTYELCGPRVNGNPEDFKTHTLLPHGAHILGGPHRTYAEIKDYLLNNTMEGIVWHHPDGRMVKIKRKDFTKEKPSQSRSASS